MSYNENTAGNSANSDYRADAPDVDVNNSIVGWFDNGEWLEYTVDVTTAGRYEVTARAARSGAGGQFTLTAEDGTNLSGTQTLGDTGGWGTAIDKVFEVELAAGVQTLRFTRVDDGGLNLDWLEFEAVQPEPENPDNLLSNGNFGGGIEGWFAYYSDGAGTISHDTSTDNGPISGGALNLDLSTASGPEYYYGAVGVDGGFTLQPNTTYELSYAIVGEGSRDVNIEVRDDDTAWLNTSIAISTTPSEHVHRFSTDGSIDGVNKLWFFHGTTTTAFTLDNVLLKEVEAGDPGNPGDLVDASVFNNRDYAFLNSLHGDQSKMDDEVRAEYASWKSRFLQTPSDDYRNNNGGGTMYFVTGYDQAFAGVENSAVSEALAYGMVAAALMDDQEAFDGLWRFGKTKLNGNGLLEWLYYGDGYTVQSFGGGTGRVNATDADLDAAYALLVAAAKWGGNYAADARALIDNMLEYNVTDDNYLTSGDDGYDYTNNRATLNRPLVLSYIAVGYMRMFADYTGNTRWDTIADQANTQLANNQNWYRNQNGGDTGGAGLASFRVEPNGNPSSESGSKTFNSDAARIGWRTATDVAWFGTDASETYVENWNGFVRRKGLDSLYDAYNEFGNNVQNWANTDAGWVAMSMGSGMLLSNDQGERNYAWDTLQTANGTIYYSASTKLLGMFFAAGWYQNPVNPA